MQFQFKATYPTHDIVVWHTGHSVDFVKEEIQQIRKTFDSLARWQFTRLGVLNKLVKRYMITALLH